MRRSRLAIVIGSGVLVTSAVLVPLGRGAASSTVVPAPGTIVATAGNGTQGSSGSGGPAVDAQLVNPVEAVTDASGNVYIADDGCSVRKVSPAGVITTVAGIPSSCGNSGDNGPATSALLGDAVSVAVDTSGNLYIGDTQNHVVRKVDTSGIITKFAGTGTQGSTGDNGPATAAELNQPWGVRVDLSGDVYISDFAANVVRKVAPDGIITPVAGNGTGGNTGDHGPATAAELHNPAGLAVDPSGNLFIADEGNNVIRKVDSSGTITTVAGNGSSTHSGDNGPATSAGIAVPYGVAEDPAGNLYIPEINGPDVRKVDASTGIITTYAGTAGTAGNSGDNGPAAGALFEGPTGVSVDLSGNLLISDVLGYTVRTVLQASAVGQGYFTVAADGGIFNYGPEAGFFGSTGSLHLNEPVVGMARTPDGKGYWLVASDGGIFNFGDAGFFGSTGSLHLNKPIVGMAATPDGKGYWLVASDGGIFNFGDAGFFGSAGSLSLNKPVVGMAASATGKGYWLAASDGGIFNYGDAGFHGSAGSVSLNKPMVGMAATADGMGYWLVASDGGIFNYGSAGFVGSAGALHLNKPVVGMAPSPDGKGYWLVAADGGIFNYGDAGFFGSAGALTLNQPVVGMAPAR